jgi:hypothetical protein
MHARYEAAWKEYNQIDEQQPKRPADYRDPDWSTHYSCSKGMEANFRETNLLRQAIIYQVPKDDRELSVLAFHVSGLFDAATKLDDGEKEALEEGLSTIFDYLVSEGRADMQEMGEQFSASAMIAFHRRRFRTGQVED